MSSFDMESFSTKITLQEAIDLCVENLLDNKEYFHNTYKDFFRDLFM